MKRDGEGPNGASEAPEKPGGQVWTVRAERKTLGPESQAQKTKLMGQTEKPALVGLKRNFIIYGRHRTRRRKRLASNREAQPT